VCFMLPPKLPRKPKRSTRWRSQAHCSFLRSHHCSIAGCMDMPIEVAHVRMGSGAGIGEKPSDHRAVPLCSAHHRRQHEIGERTFWAGIDLDGLIEAFCKASPKAAEIRIAKQERERA